jgi:excisionase family DNA binding protein
MSEPKEYLSTEGLAALLDVPVDTVYEWRKRRKGPPGAKVGRHLRFRRTDVDKWWAEQLLAAR